MRRAMRAAKLIAIALTASVICCCGRQATSVSPASRASAPTPRLVSPEILPSLLPSLAELPAGLELSHLDSGPAGSVTWVRESWASPPGPKGRPLSASIELTVASSPDDADNAAQAFRSVAAASFEVSRDDPRARLGEKVWGFDPLDSIVFVRGNVACRVGVGDREHPDGDAERTLALATRVADRIQAAASGKPEPAAVVPITRDEWESVAPRRAVIPGQRLWNDETLIGVQMEGDIPRAIPARRLGDDYLVPLVQLVAAIGVKGRVLGDDRIAVYLVRREVMLRKGSDKAVVDGSEIILHHPVAVVDNRPVVPLSSVESVLAAKVSWRMEGQTPVARLALPEITAQTAADQVRLLPSPRPEDRVSMYPEVAVAKRVYEFDHWPGKRGKLRPGLNVRGVLGEAIAKWRWQTNLASPLVRPQDMHDAVTDVTRLYWHGERTWGSCRVTVYVAPSCVQAQEVLVQLLAGQPRGRWHVLVLRPGLPGGEQLGDISYSGGAGSEDEVMLVRNNVCVHVSATSKHRDGQPDVTSSQIARLIDRALLSEPAVDSLDGYRPTIQRVTVQGHSQPLRFESAREGDIGPFALWARVTDPRGERCVLDWVGGDGVSINRQLSGSSVMLLHFGRVPRGVWRNTTITLSAISESGLVARQTLPLQYRLVSEDKPHRP